MTTYFVVRRTPGPGWPSERPLRSQAMWPEHAAFMNALAAERFVVLGEVIGSSNDALLVIDALSETAVRTRLNEDPWDQSKTLLIHSVEPWTILLNGRD